MCQTGVYATRESEKEKENVNSFIENRKKKVRPKLIYAGSRHTGNVLGPRILAHRQEFFQDLHYSAHAAQYI